MDIITSLLNVSAGLGGFASFLSWLEIKPRQLAGAKTARVSIGTRKLKLAAGLILFLISIGMSVFSLYRSSQLRSSVSDYPVKDPLEVIDGKKYANREVVLDGKRFQHCDFTNVTLTYHGLAAVDIIQDSFHGSVRLLTDNQSIKAFETLQQGLENYRGVDYFFHGMEDPNGNVTKFNEFTKQP